MKIRMALGTLVIVLGMTVWGPASQAGDEESCKAECHAEHKECIEACGRGADPIECEASCSDDRYACVEDCE